MSTHSVKTNKTFEILVREHHHRMLAFAMALGAEREIARDIVQDAFVIAYRKLDEFDPNRDFGAWVRGIVRNKFLQSITRRRETPMDPAIINEIEALHAGWDRAAPGREGIFAHLRYCMNKLPDLLGQAVREFYFNRKSCQEVADLAGAETATIRKRLQRSREQLAECVRQQMTDLA